MYVDANGKLVEESEAQAEWERKTGMALTPDNPPSPPPTPPPAPTFDSDEDQPPYTMAEVNQMTGAELAVAIAAGEIVIVSEGDE